LVLKREGESKKEEGKKEEGKRERERERERETSEMMSFCSLADTSLAFQDTRQVMNAFCQSFHGLEVSPHRPPIFTCLESDRKI